MEINIVNQTEETKWEEYLTFFTQISEKTSRVLKVSEDASCSVIFVTPEMIREINRDYRSIDKATDVISFALKDSAEDYMITEEIDEELGDIFINIQAVVDQAAEYGHSVKREVCFLFTHGLLHLLGYDHMNEEDEKVMFSLQDVILDDLVPKEKIWRKFSAAFEGITFGLKNDGSIALQMFIGALVIAYGVIYSFTMIEWIVVILLILLVIAFEFMNSAIEEIVDMISPHYSEKAKIIKDYAAAAVLLMALAALVIGLAILKGVLR